MTIEEQAEELIEQHEDIYQYRPLAIEHAILTVNIILEQLYRINFFKIDDATITVGYWSEVKKELNKLNK